MLENICKNCFEEITVMPCPHCGYNGELPEKGEILSQGTILNGRYMLGKVLGHGGFGITYLGYDLNFEFKVAIKEYYPDGLCTRTRDSHTVHSYSGEATDNYQYGKSKFIDEGKTMAKLSEIAAIVNVKDYFMQNNSAYLVMEYLEGITLKDYLKSKSANKISWEETKEIILPVIRALSDVHKIGIIHRDISPDNIFITNKGQVKLLDFGAARFAMSEKSKSLSVILKQGYAPPEQYSSKGKQGVWTDVYALCATIYRCLTGKPPEESIDRMGGEKLDSISNYAQIPAHIERAIIKGLNISYEDRFNHIDELLVILNDSPINDKGYEQASPIRIPSKNVTPQEQLRLAKIELESAYEILTYLYIITDDEKAREFCEMATNQFPENATILDNIGMYYINKGHPKIAKEFLEDAYTINEKKRDLNYHLAQIYKGEGDIQKATEFVQMAKNNSALTTDHVKDECINELFEQLKGNIKKQ